MSCPNDTREHFVGHLVNLNALLSVLTWHEHKDFFPIPGTLSGRSGLPSELEAFAWEICLPYALETATLAHAVQAGGILTDEPHCDVWDDATAAAVGAYGALAAAMGEAGDLAGLDLIQAAQAIVRCAHVSTLTAFNAENETRAKAATGVSS